MQADVNVPNAAQPAPSESTPASGGDAAALASPPAAYLNAAHAHAGRTVSLPHLLAWTVVVALVGLALLGAALMLHTRGFNLPILDQFENNAPLAIRAHDGTLQLGDLFRQNFDHRLFWSNLITVVVTWTTGWNLKVEMIINYLVMVASFALVLVLARRAIHTVEAGVPDADAARRFPLRWLWVAVPVALLVFALRHNVLWMWSILIGVPLAVMFLLLALWLIERLPVGWVGVTAAALLCVALALTQLHGMLGWGLIVVALWLRGYRSPLHYALFIVVGVATVGLYMIGYDFSMLGADQDGNGAGLVFDPLKLAGYMLTYMGNPFVGFDVRAIPAALVIGTGGLLLGVANLWVLGRARGLRALTVWVALAGFAVGSGILTGMGRSIEFPNIPQPLMDRYVLPASVGWIAVIVTGALVMRLARRPDARRATRWLARLNAAALVPLALLYVTANQPMLDDTSFYQPSQVACTLRFPWSRNVGCMDYMYLKQTELRTVFSLLDQLAVRGLAGYADAPPPFSAITYLHEVPRTIVNGDGEQIRFDVPLLEPGTRLVGLRLPPPANIEFEVVVPDTAADVRLGGGVWVERGSVPAPITFAAGVRTAAGDVIELFREVYDPAARAGAVQPYNLDLNRWRGETVTLLLATRSEGSARQVYWLDPVVITVRP